MSRIIHTIRGQPAQDGAGVKLTRYFDPRLSSMTDPFLLLDAFGSDQADDYIAGFPPHPHRGFETVTYMLEGRMQHRDDQGNEGDLGPGDVQWMTAGRGIIHSEMPQQQSGRLFGFQLWVNLPAADKLTAPAYQDIAADRIPLIQPQPEVSIKLIAGRLGDIEGAVRERPTQPFYADVRFAGAAELTLPLTPGRRLLLLPYQGELELAGHGRKLPMNQLSLLDSGDELRLKADAPAAALVISGRPLGEPVAHYGPFVMNTTDELRQAVADYQQGRLTA
ncbi:MAG: pirin family protein [Wenzhouxiangellaceae bacterium]